MLRLKSLKGIDMAVWETFSALGLGIMVRHVTSEPVKRRLIGSQILKPYYGGSEEFDVDPLEKFPDEAFKKTYVHWLTEPGNQEEQVTYMAYGNESSPGVDSEEVERITPEESATRKKRVREENEESLKPLLEGLVKNRRIHRGIKE
ncbi:2og-fe oxygenase family protein [Diaporthe amygdali]|uniref:2og-fe oxygenase family protein n=1 Tax=Phomopsis amygdali TaxID=1214568 RepID=UPI0022FDCC43|nr:2og-fe oxygenase family protein [Diaporthe amygdali]KAJ0119138.1 2og-fe oxygenase family protein [Diaporthe amygdali]